MADIAYLAPLTFTGPPEANAGPNLRGGYDFDVCSPEVVLTRMSVRNGGIVLPDDMRYQTLG